MSVLFADLVGFTTLSEHRDPEEIRELLSRYFDRCRSLIERYGGTVEKFIGDAVMAVWGTPVAREDDAERAVRAALSLTQAVPLLGAEVGMPELRVRAGVLTGSASVEMGGDGEGMVLGDTVNTAARLQSVAGPGSVLVDDVTRRASEAAIAYEDAGLHEVKGRQQPVHAWTALRVVAGVGGARRSAGLEAPFVGREQELETVIEAFERSAGESRARLVAVVGEAGAGKSRLLWEYFKYLDGVERLVRWHQGRCLSYGEGVGYWALAEMIRGRAGIAEEEPAAEAREKLRVTVATFVSDERERRLVEPRLAHLLRLEERPDADRADLFSGWRLFFERMAATEPVVLAFEDLQWADSGLLEFVDYLLEWSADNPIFVLALGRPELRQRRPGWEPLVLDPLPPESIGAILEGLAPGLPAELRREIGQRAEGIPLYVVETIRMLQDRGLLVQEGSRYVVTGDVTDLEVPETLQALVASRLDGLSAGERALLQDASVLGQSFSGAAAAALNGRPESEVLGLLNGLVGKQIVGRDDDPRSPERGQFHFLQALLRTVAYGTLSRRARKARHLAAAEHLRSTWPGESRDIAEVLASHYLEAIRADPEAEDVTQLRASARRTLTEAGRAAASLLLGPEAQRYYEQAAELAEDDEQRADLFEQAGRALRDSGHPQAAAERLRRAIELREASGTPLSGRAAIVLASMLRYEGRLDEARALLERFRGAGSGETDLITQAEARTELASIQVAAGEMADATGLIENSLTILEEEQAWASLVPALITRAVYLVVSSRFEEGHGVLRHALLLSEQHDLPQSALRARFNLAAVSIAASDFRQALEELAAGLRQAHERGDRFFERTLRTQQMAPLFWLGRWDEAVQVGMSIMAGERDVDAVAVSCFVAPIASARGDQETMARCLEMSVGSEDSASVDLRTAGGLVLARAALEEGNLAEVHRLSDVIRATRALPPEFDEEAYALSIEAAIASGDDEVLRAREASLSALRPGRSSPLLRALRQRCLAELAHREGNADGARRAETEAEALLRSIRARPRLAQALLERARRRVEPEALAEARAIYEDLRATRWLSRLDQEFGVVA
ncbi:MAG: adenylate/guanylate cyclase domain-containing protein [Solirubrobacteraceae bacterium]